MVVVPLKWENVKSNFYDILWLKIPYFQYFEGDKSL